MAKKEPLPARETRRIDEHIRSLLAMRDEAQAEVTVLGEAIARLQEIAGGNVSQIERPQAGPFRYAGLGIIAAIELYLERKGAAASRDELREEMITGGAMVGHKPAYVDGNIRKSINRNLEAEPPRLKEIGDMIGLPEWTDEEFHQDANPV